MSEKAIEYSIEYLEIHYDDFVFGEYLRNVRRAKKISIRELAKRVNKTATYLSDIEKGNNKPPEKELLETIIKKLNLEDCPKVKTALFDLAAKDRNDIPADIKEHMLNNKPLLDLIRKIKNSSNECDVLLSVQKILNELGGT